MVSLFKKAGMIPVFYHERVDVCRKVIDVTYEEGVQVFEFTNRGGNAYTVFKELKKHVSQYPEYKLGIGTVMDDETTAKYIDVEADFIVSPIIKESMGKLCNESGKFWIPGCGTVTEMVRAKEAGASLVKIFPASVLGPDFVSSVLPVLPGVHVMPTGGIEPSRESLQRWYKSGVTCVGMGSQLFDKQLIANQEWKQLQSNVAEALKIIQDIITPKSKTIIPIL